eukprot:5940640-Pyramimonas_sp.AAC.1
MVTRDCAHANTHGMARSDAFVRSPAEETKGTNRSKDKSIYLNRTPIASPGEQHTWGNVTPAAWRKAGAHISN